MPPLTKLVAPVFQTDHFVFIEKTLKDIRKGFVCTFLKKGHTKMMYVDRLR